MWPGSSSLLETVYLLSRYSIFDDFYFDLGAFFRNLIIALKAFKGIDCTVSASWGTPSQKESISYPEALLVSTAGNQ